MEEVDTLDGERNITTLQHKYLASEPTFFPFCLCNSRSLHLFEVQGRCRNGEGGVAVVSIPIKKLGKGPLRI